MADEKGHPKNALFRRFEQLERWKGSATDQEPPLRKRPEIRVKFDDGCMFLAACSSGDLDEVRSFLARGADINTANIDGLTALHQACIDQNMNMVEFLVENNADVNVGDNEGWTPLHATASCGFTEIARYMIECGASVAAVNNDGELPFDLCESERMEALLSEEMEKQGIDAEAARKMEENMMLADANQWLNNRNVKEKPHSQTGATSLHVAAAKGYVNVMKVLIQANANLNVTDLDGWTPLHAAAHWGQEDAIKLLAESLCDMEIQNTAGQTAFDVADPDVLGILEEEKKKQATLREKVEITSDIIQTKPTGKRRSSVTRMSGGQKHDVMTKSTEEDKAVLSGEEKEGQSCSSSSDGETSDSETDKKNAINKKAKLEAPVTTPEPPAVVVTEPSKDTSRVEEIQENSKPEPEKPTPSSSVIENVPSLVLPDDTSDRLTNRRALLKTGSSSMLPDTPPTNEIYSYRGRVLRSLSSPRIPHNNTRDQTPAKESVPAPTTEPEKTENKLDRKIEEEKKEKERADKVKEQSPTETPKPAEKESKTVTKAKEEVAKEKTPERTSPDKLLDKKDLPTPTRRIDSTQTEEAELQRKARAKRSRETRRPTQGVTRDDIVKAEEVLKASQDDKDKTPSSSAITTSTTTTTTTTGDGLKDPSIRRPRTLEERKEQDESRTSTRRSRIPDLSSSTSSIPTKSVEPSTITQNTPSSRNSLISTVSNSEPSLTTGSSLNRSTSLRRSRITEPEKVQEETKEEKKEETKDTKLSSASRARKRREKRNLTGIINQKDPNNENKEETDETNEDKKEDKKEEDSKEERTSDYSYRGSSSRYNRPNSYADISKSTSSLDSDYKRMYEDEKSENDKLKKDLAQTKRDLEQAQREIDRALRKRDSDAKQEKRALERKVSELEEELKNVREDIERVKQENQALIRVISRLSR